MITKETLSPINRDKKIGNSQYRICKKNNNSGKWYILEMYNDGIEWANNTAYYNDDLQSVLDKFNSIAKEKEIVSLRF